MKSENNRQAINDMKTFKFGFEKTLALIMVLMLGVPSCIGIAFGKESIQERRDRELNEVITNSTANTPGYIKHRDITPSMYVTTNAWSSVSNILSHTYIEGQLYKEGSSIHVGPNENTTKKQSVKNNDGSIIYIPSRTISIKNQSISVGYTNTVGKINEASENSISIGNGAFSHPSSIAVGHTASSGSHSVSVGMDAKSNNEGMAIGDDSKSDQGVSVGRSSDSVNGVSIGRYSKSKFSISIGENSNAAGYDSIAIGNNSHTTTNADRSIQFGKTMTELLDTPDTIRYFDTVLYKDGLINDSIISSNVASQIYAPGMGKNIIAPISNTNSEYNINADSDKRYIYMSAQRSDNTTKEPGIDSVGLGSSIDPYGPRSIAIGRLSKASFTHSIAIGDESNSSANNSISIGKKSYSAGISPIAIGDNARAYVNGNASAIAIGKYSIATGAYDEFNTPIAIGYGAVANGQRRIQIGSGTNSMYTYDMPNNTLLGIDKYAVLDDSGKIFRNRIPDDYVNRNDLNDFVSDANDYINSISNNFSQEIIAATNAIVGNLPEQPEVPNIYVGSGYSGSIIAPYDVSRHTSITNISAIILNNYEITNYYGNSSISIGRASSALGYGGISIGQNSTADSYHSMSFGISAKSSERSAIAIGSYPTASGKDSISIGTESLAKSTGSVSIGKNASASNTSSIAIGEISRAAGQNSISIGYNANTPTNYSVSIGYYSAAEYQNSVALGRSAHAKFSNSIAIGRSAYATNMSSVAVGHEAKAYGHSSVAIGREANATTDNSVSIGYNNYATAPDSIAIGSSLSIFPEATNSVVLGSNAICMGPNVLQHNNKVLFIDGVLNDTAIPTNVALKSDIPDTSNFITNNQNIVVNSTTGSTGQYSYSEVKGGSVAVGHSILGNTIRLNANGSITHLGFPNYYDTEYINYFPTENGMLLGPSATNTLSTAIENNRNDINSIRNLLKSVEITDASLDSSDGSTPTYTYIIQFNDNIGKLAYVKIASSDEASYHYITLESLNTQDNTMESIDFIIDTRDANENISSRLYFTIANLIWEAGTTINTFDEPLLEKGHIYMIKIRNIAHNNLTKTLGSVEAKW